MSTDATTVETERRSAGERGALRPFSGVICPYIGFESGHTIWLLAFDDTPTPLSSFAEVWVEYPDGTSTLYTPGEVRDYVTKNHEFDSVVEATVTWHPTDHEAFDLTMEGEDGTTLDVRLEFAPTMRTRVLDIIGAITPDSVARTDVGSALSTFVFNLLLPMGGTKVKGRTETGLRYYTDPDRILAVTTARATLDGTDLGNIAPPRSARTRGDVEHWRAPYALFGRLHLEYPAPDQSAPV